MSRTVPAPTATPTDLPLLAEQRLLFNQETRRRLSDAGLLALVEQPLTLRAAQRLGLWLGSSGSDLLLAALHNAALRSMTASYLTRRGYQPGWQGFTAAERYRHLNGLGDLLLRGYQAYPHPAATETALHRDAPRERAVAARTSMTNELFLLEVQLDNPAMQPYRDLFDDRTLAAGEPWRPPLQRLADLLADKLSSGPWGRDLRDLLREPLRAAPDSLAGQVAYVLAAWAA